MITQARAIHPYGGYRVIADGDLSQFEANRFDLVLAAVSFDNIPTMGHNTSLFSELARLLAADGRIVNLVSSPNIHAHEWASLSTRNFPGNRKARSGDTVRIIMTHVDDSRPVEDILCSDADYRTVCRDAGLDPLATYRPLETDGEPSAWVNRTSPRTVDHLRSQDSRAEHQRNKDPG